MKLGIKLETPVPFPPDVDRGNPDDQGRRKGGGGGGHGGRTTPPFWGQILYISYITC